MAAPFKYPRPDWTRRYPALHAALPIFWNAAATDDARAAVRRLIADRALCVSLLPPGCGEARQTQVGALLLQAAWCHDVRVLGIQKRMPAQRNAALRDAQALNDIADRRPEHADVLRGVADKLDGLAATLDRALPQFPRVRVGHKGAATPADQDRVRHIRIAAVALHDAPLGLSNEAVAGLLTTVFDDSPIVIDADSVGNWVRSWDRLRGME